MRKTLVVVVALLMSILFAFPVFAETNIVVNGGGEVLVPADIAIVSLGVNLRDEDVEKAQSTANEAIDAIRNALMEEMGIPQKDIMTDNLDIYTIYDYDKEPAESVGYNVNSTLAIRSSDMENIGRIIDIAFENGANNLIGVRFSVASTTEAEKEALTQAVADAQEKAEVIAEAAGLTITDTVKITDGYTEQMIQNAEYAFLNAETANKDTIGTYVQAANVSVFASINIEYLAE